MSFIEKLILLKNAMYTIKGNYGYLHLQPGFRKLEQSDVDLGHRIVVTAVCSSLLFICFYCSDLF